MSRHFVESFFPSTTALLLHFVPDTVQRFFPHDLDERCPEVTWQLSLWVGSQQQSITTTTTTTSIRNPMLAICITMGIFIGLYGAVRIPILTTTTTTHPAWTVHHNQQRHHYRRVTAPWIKAFVAFGIMNATALPLHCLRIAEQEKDGSGCYWCWCWYVDCLATGISSIHLVEGALREIIMFFLPETQQQQQQEQQQPSSSSSTSTSSSPPLFWRNNMDVASTQRIVLTTWVRFCYAMMVLATLLSLWCNVSIVQVLTNGSLSSSSSSSSSSTFLCYNWWKEPFWIEWIYLGPTLVAALVCPLAVGGTLWQEAIVTSRNWETQKDDKSALRRVVVATVIMLSGVGLGLLGVTAVDWFCRHMTTTVADALSAPTLVFAGCNLSFVGLYLWLRVVLCKTQQHMDQQSATRAKVKRV